MTTRIEIMVATILSVVMASAGALAGPSYAPVASDGFLVDGHGEWKRCDGPDIGVRERLLEIVSARGLVVGWEKFQTMALHLDDESGQRIDLPVDEYDTGLGKWRFHLKEGGWVLLTVLIWPASTNHAHDQMWIAVHKKITGKVGECVELWRGPAHEIKDVARGR